MLTFITNDPQRLLRSYKKAIQDGHVQTWEMSGDDFAHTPEQFRFKAWMRPIVTPAGLVIAMVGRNDERISRGIYAVFHGRFSESVLAHCDDLFESCVASARLIPNVDLYLSANDVAA
jgi:hypothetical protein